MASARSGGSLTELARLGFSELEATVGKLDRLVSLVGDGGRVALASLAKAANPDQALNALLHLAESDVKALKGLLKKNESADRLCLVLGASSALVDFVKRHPETLSLFEKPVSSLDDQPAMTERIRLALAPVLADSVGKKIANPDSPFDSEACWNAVRVAYRHELIRISVFDLSSETPWQALQPVAAALA
ncbi:MAG: hypothetical protein ACKOWK_00625, partial [Micrococcales bacterium]